jgi:hypothetical protein
LFAGSTDDGLARRGVIAFDIAGNIPPGSAINSASLRMNMSRTPSTTAQAIGLHKLLADWGEGISNAGAEEGRGAPATTNDATWRHRFFSTSFWSTQGGDFFSAQSASSSVGPLGLYTWSSPQLTADVQGWLNTPASNFGWLIVGAEGGTGTTKRFDTRESTSPPVLTIEYTPPASAAQPVSAVSRKVHGGVSTYDINLPFTGAPGIESRSGDVIGNYQIVFTFPTAVSVSGASVTSGLGTVASTQTSDNGLVTVNLSGVANAQTITVTLTGVSGGTSTVSVQMGILGGDINGDRRVNVGDTNEVKFRGGQAANGENFRADVNGDGRINVGDSNFVKAHAGASL